METFFQGFATEAILHEGRTIVVARCRRLVDGLSVVIKSVRPNVGSHQDRARVAYEHKLLLQIIEQGVHHVLQPLALLTEQAALGPHVGMVSRDIGGVSLRAHGRGALSFPEILHVAERVALALESVHKAGVVHKDVNPSNVVFNRDSGEVELIDFGISTAIAQEHQTVDNLRMLEGTLQYMSPEQTGRLNRALDYRSDYYSLGATLYELCAGRAPFPAQEVGPMVHSILTQEPPQLTTLNPQVPPGLAAIIGKLLAKEPGSRYQSATGLLHDLRRCAAAPLETFALATQDESAHFSLPDKLYGRDEQIAQLRDACARISAGKREMIMVSGPSGMGKSALISEIDAAIVQHNGIFIRGKYDPLRRHVPFNALSQAITALVRRLLMEPEEALDPWRRRIQEGLGHVGQCLVEIAPALELLVGPQKPLPELAPQENEGRFLSVLQRLILTLCERQPLVLFLDDLQWADSGTLKLLTALAGSTKPSAGMLVVGAFRDNELPTQHPLRKLLADINKSAMPLMHLTLAPMQESHVQAWLADATHVAAAETQPLAAMVVSKTAGNPFFVREFVAHLVRKDLLKPDQGQWRWDLQQIAAAAVTDNVVALLHDRLTQMSPAAQHTLSVAACLGNEFSLQLLCEVGSRERSEVVEHLATCLDMGLLVAIQGAHRFAADTQDEVVYKFCHDRIQEAAYALLDPTAAIELHDHLGKHLRSHGDAAHPETWIFGAVDHLNLARSRATTPAALIDLAELNLLASLEAKRAVAYNAMSAYLENAVAALPADSWESAHTLRYRIGLELFDATFLQGNTDGANQVADEILSHTTTPLERAEVQRRRILCLATYSRYPEALQLALACLADLGVHLPAKVKRQDAMLAVLQFEMSLRRRGVGQMTQLPELANPEVEMVLNICSTIVVFSFYMNKFLFVLLGATMGRLLVQHGRSPSSALTCAVLAVTYQQIGREARAESLRVWTRHFLAQYPHSVLPSSCIYFVDGLSMLTRLTPAQQEVFMDNLHEQCMDTGERFLAAVCVFANARNVGLVSVEGCLAKLEWHKDFIAARGTPQTQQMVVLLRQMCKCLQGKTDGPTSLDDSTFKLANASEAMRIQGGMHFRLVVSMVHRVLDAAVTAAGPGTFLEQANTQTNVTYALYAGLAYVQSYPTGPLPKPARKIIAACVRQLRRSARTTPKTFGGLDLLLLAECAAQKQDHAQAVALYAQAVERVGQSGMPSYVAITLECAGRYHAGRANHVLARGMLSQAYEAYSAWGARLKLQLLAREYPRYFTSAMSQEVTTLTASTTTEKVDLDQRLDLPALVESLQALSAEVTAEGLVKRVLHSVLQSAGATRAVLLLEESGHLVVKADSEERPEDLPHDVLQYAQRGRQDFVVDDAPNHEDFSRDAYIAHNATKSLLCATITQQGDFRGLIYLENKHITGAFTPSRVTVVRLLAGQAAAALDGVRNRTHMEQLIGERTAQLRDAHTKLLLMERNATEGQMAGGFAHEIRNALAGAKLAMAMVYPDDGAATPELPESPEGQTPHEEIYKEVNRGLERALRISAQILEYAEASTLLAGDHAADVSATLADLLREFDPAFTRNNIQVQTQVPGDVALAMRTEHAHVIMRHLLSNARDAMVAEPQRPRALQIRANLQGDQVIVEIQDSGIGMEPAVAHRVFEPFFSTKGAHGMGLGLGLARKLTQVYGGVIEFQSAPLQGTTFRLRVPSAGHRHAGRK